MTKKPEPVSKALKLVPPAPRPPAPSSGPAPDEQKPVYSFRTRPRCRRCNSLNTVATETRGRIQKRICRNSVCREKFFVIGTEA